MTKTMKAFDAVPFKIELAGKVNGEQMVINGMGVVPQLGTYVAMLNFNIIPPGFHPAAIGTYSVSICCYAFAAMRNGGLNISAMGASGYSSKRVLKIGKDTIIIEGEVNLDPKGTTFLGKISGTANLPKGISGNSTYLKRITPVAPNKLIGVGEGSLFVDGGGEVPVGIETIHTLKPGSLPKFLKQPQFRIVSESGVVIGTSYKTKVYSILDGSNTMERVSNLKSTLI